jgi:hypothetical protein
MKPTVSETSSSRHEQGVRREGVAARQGVEQRRLAGVRVAHQGDRRDRGLVSALAELGAAAADGVDLLRQDADAMPDPPPVGLELRFTGSERADAAARARQRVARPDQARHHVFELGELDLELALPRAGAPREDVENELRAVDDFPIERALEVPQLRGRQLVVEDHQVHARLAGGGGEHLDLALPEKRRGIRLRALLLYAQYGIGARGRREPRQLVERMFGVEVPGRILEETDERGAFALDHGHWEMVSAVGVFRGSISELVRAVGVFRGITAAILARAPTAPRPA